MVPYRPAGGCTSVRTAALVNIPAIRSVIVNILGVNYLPIEVSVQFSNDLHSHSHNLLKYEHYTKQSSITQYLQVTFNDVPQTLTMPNFTGSKAQLVFK